VINRRALLVEAAQAASDARDRAGFDMISPIDVYELARRLDLRVLFLDVSMEGIYQKGPPSRVILSAQRPLARRAYTCAHEIGHHWFGHGSILDELQADDRKASEKPEEILAEGFGGFLMMPTIGLRRAFAKRGWQIETAAPAQFLTVASEFGVGFSTIVTHLAYTVRDLSAARRTELDKWTPQRIRRQMFGEQEIDALTIIDAHTENSAIDLEVGHGLAVPHDAQLDCASLTHLGTFGTTDLYRAQARGVGTLSLGGPPQAVRIAPENFTGRAIFRHEDDPDA
jgi:Zn-dependent peptidase ImmA (M78 family)